MSDAQIENLSLVKWTDYQDLLVKWTDYQDLALVNAIKRYKLTQHQ